jgi:sterol desaturase/sphingolipid hydroxylase (fatty acid hydroxylase superfamily)
MDLLLRPLLTIGVIGLVFTGLELLRPARRPPQARWRRYLTDFLHLTLGGFLIRAGTAALLAWLLARSHVTEFGGSLPLWLQFVCVLAVCDLMIWLIHRLFHAVPMLWEFHKIHHSSEHLDWLAAYRVHPLDQIATAVLVPVPALLLGFSPVVVVVYMAVYQWHAILLHSNVAVSLGPLERAIATNRFHHWHHADHAEAYDRNFGAQLVIWDRLFGTAHTPAQPRPDRFGVSDAPRESFLAHLLSPFARSIAR